MKSLTRLYPSSTVPSGATDQMSEWMSWILGEFILLSEPESLDPFAVIDSRIRSTSLTVDKLLTIIEAEFLDQREPWANVLRNRRCTFQQVEKIEDRDCWKFTNTDSSTLKLEMWFAPDLGYAPVRGRQSAVDSNGGVKSFTDYRVMQHQRAGEAYIPKSAIIIVGQPARRPDAHIHEYQVELLGYGDDDSPRSIRDSLPENTLVRDHLRLERYRVRGGQLVDRERLDLDELAGAQAALAADFKKDDLEKSRSMAIYGVIAASAAVVVAVLLGRKYAHG